MNRKLNMPYGRKVANVVLSMLIGLTLIFSAARPIPVSASTSPARGDGIRRGVHPQTGMLTFLGADASNPIRVEAAMRQGLAPEARGNSILDVYGSEFGIRDAKRELSMVKSSDMDGRLTLRYQQVYNKIPVMGGELIVNMKDDGSLLSISGEASPDLKVDTQPKLNTEQAVQLAVRAIAKTYKLKASDLTASKPELWIFDERLIQDNASQPVHLVWRMEVISATAPVRELVLVNANTGKISLHFNQIDTAWRGNPIIQNVERVKDDVTKPVVSFPANTEPVAAPVVVAGQPIGAPVSGTSLFVNAASGNDANDCLYPASACLTINGAIAKPQAAGNTIYVAGGIYTGYWSEVVHINKSLNLSGGWNTDFTNQDEASVIDGQGDYDGITVDGVTVIIEHFIIQSGIRGIVTYGNLTILNSTIQKNHSGGSGGGVDNSGSLTIINSTIANNSARTGGGIYNEPSGSLIVRNSTIVSNNAYGSYSGGGIYKWYSLATIQNSIITNNMPTDCEGGFSSLGHNIFGSISASECGANVGVGDIVGIDPLLSSMPIGVRGYYALQLGSPAIDAGDPAGCGATDQRGVARPQGAVCDIGAYEYIVPGMANVVEVASGSNQRLGPGMITNSQLSVYLLDGVGSPVPGVEVTFVAPISGASITFTNSGANTAAITTNESGLVVAPEFTANNILGSYLVNIVSDGGAGTADLSMTNVEPWYVSPIGDDANTCASPATACATIQGAIGKAVAGDPIKVGSGTYTNASTSSDEVVMILKDIVLSGGWNTDFTSQDGVSVIDGQGAQRGVTVDPLVTATIEHFTIHNGTMGIYSAGNLVVRNTTIQGNKSYFIGGGVYNDNGELSVSSSTIVNNSFSTGRGGGIYSESSPVRVYNNIIAGNTSDCMGAIKSLGHNIIGKPGCQVTAQTSDKFNVDPLLSAYPVGVGRYYVLRPGSPAIDAGPATCEVIDQRGVARPQGAACDIGAYETTTSGVADAIGVTFGSDQTIGLGLQASLPMVVYVTDGIGTPVPGMDVTFTAPLSGASGTFQNNGTNTTIVTTNESGLASAPAFAGNYVLGNYIVSATVVGVTGSADFNLSNVATYVSPVGNDANTCASPDVPCVTIRAAIGKAIEETTIYVASGTYSENNSWPEVVHIYRNVSLSGGWNADFTNQDGVSIIDGQEVRRGVWMDSDYTATIDHFTIQNGTTGVLSRGRLTIKNSTIQGNDVGVRNDGSWFNSSMSIISSTIANNGSNTFTRAAYGPTTVSNSIIANNSRDCSGAFSSLGHNIVGDISGCEVIAGLGDQFNIDPMLSSYPVGIGGYYALLPGSPAVDVGAGCDATDQRGVPRPQGAACDIGAYEYIASGAAQVMEVAFGSGQRVGSGMIANSLLGVYVLDENGSPMPGVDVTFTAPVSGASGVFADSGINTTVVGTNDSGLAIAPDFTANSTLGPYLIVAAATGVIGSVDLSMINVEPWYVSPSGNDANTCASPTAPCVTIPGAMRKAVAGDPIKVASGIYTRSDYYEVIGIGSIVLSGGWNADFTIQDGVSILDGQGARRGVTVSNGAIATIDHFIIQNGKYGFGGGIYNGGQLTVRNTTISFNQADAGAGIYHYGKALTIVNTTISNNSSAFGSVYQSVGGGAGLYIAGSGGRLSINNSTFTQNFTTSSMYLASGGGIKNNGKGFVVIKNSIIAGNAADIAPDCLGKILSGGHNLIGTVSGCNVTPASGDLIAEDLSGPIAAMLGDLKDNGGGVLTHALLPGSPAIDAGNPATCEVTDQRGEPRPQGAVCDIGAFEGSVAQVGTVNARTYTALNQSTYPGNLLCEGSLASCTNGSDPHADSAHAFALGTYQFYLDQHDRHSIDRNNMLLVSTVRYKTGYQNAFWSGVQMVYGDGYGFAMADDVVAHELTHGVTQSESNLFYWHQSGAINESFSDLWGEAMDQANGLGNDALAVKWLIGEDVTGLGAIRNMSNPPAYQDPDKMTSPYYYEGSHDNGGVHTNSGVNNKAVYLMVNGGTFNNKVVSLLGWNKVLAIYYEAQTNLLTSGSDYLNLYNALYQACQNKIGTSGIVAADCQEVRDATDAVQMNMEPIANFTPNVDFCPAGSSMYQTFFFDDFEGNMDKWKLDEEWMQSTNYTTSGIHTLWGNDAKTWNDTSAYMGHNIALPVNSKPYLYFAHSFVMDWFNTTYYDGGVLEYSTNNGATWNDAAALFYGGKNYGGKLLGGGNPLIGRMAFSGDSHGYVSSRYSLATLAGKDVRFRWRLGTDSYWSIAGWYVDDVRIYTCVGIPTMPLLSIPALNALVTDYTPVFDWSDSTPASDLHHYDLQLATDLAFTTGLVNFTNIPTSTYTPLTDLASNTKYYWRVRSVNAAGGTSAWSASRYFRAALLPPVAQTPGVDALGSAPNLHMRRPTFTWDAVPGATTYTVEVSTSTSFATKAISASTSATAYTHTLDLAANTTYYWRVKANGTNGPSLYSSPLKTFSTGNPPSVPTLSAPAANALQITTMPLLNWNNATVSAGAPAFHAYEVQIATNSTFTVGVQTLTVTGISNSETLTPALLNGTTYYWRVRSVNVGVDAIGGNADDDFSGWSLSRSFRIAYAAPTLILPADGVTGVALKPTFTWAAMPGATSYNLQVSKNNTFTLLVINKTLTAPVVSYTQTVNLLPNTIYYWRVRANGAYGPGFWQSPMFSFTTTP